MAGRDLEERIENLPEEKREELEDRIGPFEQELEEELFNQHHSEIDNQITDDEAELSDFNVIVSGFLEQDGTDYTFIRTEPLIHEQDRNFDVLVAAPSKGVAVLVEIERTLLDRLPGKVSRFEGKMDVVKSNGADFDVDEYFEKVTSIQPDEIDYVLSSQHLAESDLQDAAAAEGLNFIAWLLGSQGNTCRVKDFIVKESETAPFDGHADDDLREYIETKLASGVEKQDYVSFTYSSSKYLKLKHMSITLVNRFQRHSEDGSFTYEDWKQLFETDIDLYNYLEEEKQTLFKRYIKYAKEVGVIAVEESNGDMFVNEYRVKSRATKDQERLIDELMEKMARARMEEDFEEAVRKKKKEIVTELERDHATGGTTLFDFEEVDPEEEEADDD
jgi:hypothetical protein